MVRSKRKPTKADAAAAEEKEKLDKRSSRNRQLPKKLPSPLLPPSLPESDEEEEVDEEQGEEKVGDEIITPEPPKPTVEASTPSRKRSKKEAAGPVTLKWTPAQVAPLNAICLSEGTRVVSTINHYSYYESVVLTLPGAPVIDLTVPLLKPLPSATTAPAPSPAPAPAAPIITDGDAAPAPPVTEASAPSVVSDSAASAASAAPVDHPTILVRFPEEANDGSGSNLVISAGDVINILSYPTQQFLVLCVKQNTSSSNVFFDLLPVLPSTVSGAVLIGLQQVPGKKLIAPPGKQLQASVLSVLGKLFLLILFQ